MKELRRSPRKRQDFSLTKKSNTDHEKHSKLRRCKSFGGHTKTPSKSSNRPSLTVSHKTPKVKCKFPFINF